MVDLSSRAKDNDEKEINSDNTRAVISAGSVDVSVSAITSNTSGLFQQKPVDSQATSINVIPMPKV